MERFLAITLAVSLAGCNASGVLSPTAQSEVESARTNYCPVLTAVQTDIDAGLLHLNKGQQEAYATLKVACTGPTPTNGATLAIDILNAYVVLSQVKKGK